MRKRTKIELHCHTKMSVGKGVIEPGELVRYACDNGYKAIAITDCGTVQAFPEAYRTWKKLWEQYMDECKQRGEEAKQDDFLKIIYGLEGYLTDEFSYPDWNKHSLTDECTVVDIETTGFSTKKDAILRVDAVKVKDGKLGERISSYIIQEREIPEKIVKITGITEYDLKDAKPEKQVITDLISFIGNSFLVMYNAKFDMLFLKKACKKYNICFKPECVDLYKICKYLNPSRRINKPLLMKWYWIKEESTDNDCTLYGKLYSKVCARLKDRDINSIEEVRLVIDKKRVKGIDKRYPVLLYAKNETGIRNLYRIVTESHLSTSYDEPTITKEILDKYRDGILVGAVCDGGEAMTAIHAKKGCRTDAEYKRDFKNILSYYDFIEVSRLNPDEDNDIRYMYHVIDKGGMLVAASDAYYLNEEDKIYWEILTNGRAEEYTDRPRHLIKWDEVTNPFGCWFLGQPEILKDIPKMVIANQSVIADQIEYVSPLREGRFMPNYPEAEQKLRHICEEKLHELFGKDPAEEARERLERELDGICKNGYAGLFMMWRDIARKSREKGYPFNSRGSVGSSFVAFLCEITDINPLSSECGGYNIPVETFLGINLDKEPDIDLNFAPEIQVLLQDYVKDIPGVGDACHAGTIDCLWEKLAAMHVKEYYYHNNLSLPDESILREQTEAIIGIKRIDDVHPGGIVVAPAGEELVSFTPLQHPGDSNRITTTHFDYHAIDHNLIKLDILGLRHMSILHELQELTGVALDSIAVKDKKVLDKILDPEAKEIEGLLEFGSEVARRMIKQTCPESMDDLIKVSGLIHGTDVWLDNQDELFNNKVISLKDCVASRDDIFLALVDKGINKKYAFYIMESVRKGKGITEDMELKMKQAGLPDWYYDVCRKIKYLFPKAHAVSYTLTALRMAYFLTYYPTEYEEALLARDSIRV